MEGDKRGRKEQRNYKQPENNKVAIITSYLSIIT